MTSSELIEWCEQHEFPTKLAALLSIWDPDLDELEEWEIEQEGENTFHINDDSYVVLDSDEYTDAEDSTRQDIEDYLTEDVPEALIPYIDWDAFFYHHPIGIEDVLPEGDSVLFENEWYYYGTV